METLSYGSRGPNVELLQLALSRAGFSPGTIDGIFGEATLSAVIAFQAREGIRPRGTVDAETWASLRPYLVGYILHTVSEGDTLDSLAQSYATRPSMILGANPHLELAPPISGQQVVIPLDFPVVPSNIRYTSVLLEFIVEGLAARYPFLGVFSMGRSVLGLPLYVLTMGRGSRQVFYNASHHANEWITTPVLLTFLEEYAETYNVNGIIYGYPATQLFNGVTLFVAPMVNPDGVDLVTGGIAPGTALYNSSQNLAQTFPQISFPSGWKANIRGVDLNLNYPAGWELAREIKYAQGFTRPGPRDFVGQCPLSEPESAAVYNLTRSQDFALTLSYHSQGKIIYWKYGTYLPENSYEIALEMGRVSGYTVEETPAASGNAGYKDWFIQTYNLPGYTIEVGQGISPLPLSQFPEIYRDNFGILMVGILAVLPLDGAPLPSGSGIIPALARPCC